MSISILLIVETGERHTEIDLSDTDTAAIHLESCLMPHLAREFTTIIVRRSVVLPVSDQDATRVLLQMEAPSDAVAASLLQPFAGFTIAQRVERCAGPIIRQLLGQPSRFEVLAGPEVVVPNLDAASIRVTTRRPYSPR